MLKRTDPLVDCILTLSVILFLLWQWDLFISNNCKALFTLLLYQNLLELVMSEWCTILERQCYFSTSLLRKINFWHCILRCEGQCSLFYLQVLHTAGNLWNHDISIVKDNFLSFYCKYLVLRFLFGFHQKCIPLRVLLAVLKFTATITVQDSTNNKNDIISTYRCKHVHAEFSLTHHWKTYT